MLTVRSCFPNFLIILFLLLLSLTSSSRAQKLDPQEVEALKVIGSKLNMVWDFKFDPCSGSGGWINITGKINSSVTCDCSFNNNTTCHVISLNLLRQNLTGVLPEEMAKLTHLRFLDLSRNYLQGPIPAAWASLPLFNLSLQGNRLTGRIPVEFGQMPAIKSFQLEGNLLNGTIPSELGNLISLERFFISANNIVGQVPSTFAKLTNLTDFRIDGNNISGTIPDFIPNWRRVNRIDMQGTSMDGPIPDGISFLKNLTELRVTDLSGPRMMFPPLENALSLTELVLRNCSIYGEIPLYLGNMVYLKVLDLSFNMLSGQIPSNFPMLHNLLYMYLTDNKLTGDIPSWMLRNKASNKVNMDISYNDFTGNPPESCQEVNVNMVSSFSSSAAVNLPCLKKRLPCNSRAKHTSLFINCGGKEVKIDGNIYEDDSRQIGTSMFFLSESGKWAYSSTGDFVGNEDADYIARNISRLTMPHPELYTEARLSPLSLKYYGLCLKNGDYVVKLHFAEIIFTTDRTFSSNGKRIFDVLIQGVKVLRDFNIEAVAGGTGREVIKNFTTKVTDHTLEIHFYWSGKGTTAIPDRGTYGPLISAITVEKTNQEKEFPLAALVSLIVASCFLLLLLLLMLCRNCLRRRKNVIQHGPVRYRFSNRENNASTNEARAHYLFTLREIEVATSNFDPSNKIGEGGFGPVYKGILSDGTMVAVKQLSSVSRQGNREFLNEIGIISTLRHPNLVRLFGCCIEENNLVLIYEFMENNSLGRALFGHPQHQLKLDWPTRYKICIGTARGLAYLHEESPLKVVHRDIKASNILLDKNLNPKISDFGLAKLEDGGGHFSTRIVGTVGYMAPEYATRGCLTHKADIYSFGVVILEIVSGRMSSSCMFNNEFVHLLDWAGTLKNENMLLDIVDERLGSNYSKEEALRILDVALLCTNTSPAFRPAMSLVVSMISGQAPLHVEPDNCFSQDDDQPLPEYEAGCGSDYDDSTNTSLSRPSNPISGYLPSQSVSSVSRVGVPST